MKLEKDNKRESNFELLRIVAMVAILLFHYSDHGCNNIAFDNALPINVVFEYVCRIGGGLGNCVFMLLTGYFTYKSVFKISKVLKIWSQVLFYSFISYAFACGLELTFFNINDLKQVLMPITTNQYWYFTAYIAVYVMSPIINAGIEKLEKRQLSVIIVLLLYFFSIMPTFGYTKMVSQNRIEVLFVLYSVGAYIRKYYSQKNRKVLLYQVVCAFVLFGGYSIFAIFYEKIKDVSSYFVDRFCLVWGIEKITIIVFSILIFLIFKNLNIKHNVWMNWFAVSTFGVYLLHMNNWTTYYLWDNICRTKEFYRYKYMIPYVIICCLFIFLICIFIDKVRIYLVEKPVLKALENYKNPVSKLIFVLVIGTFIGLCMFLDKTKLIPVYESSLAYNECVEVITMDEGVCLEEKFYNKRRGRIEEITFHAITWNKKFPDKQIVQVSLIDEETEQIIYSQDFYMNMFNDNCDFTIQLNEDVIVQEEHWYTLSFSSNTSLNQDTIALMLTNVSNSNGQLFVNGDMRELHISAKILSKEIR